MDPAPDEPRSRSSERFSAAHFGDRVLGDLVELVGTKQPGDRLPSERELAERLGVSRTALRDRIGRLESLGILERREREGTIYTGLQPERMGEVLILGLISSEIHVESLVSVRHALERQAAILASTQPMDGGLAVMREAVARMHETDHGTELYRADNDFHRGLFLASNSSALIFFSRVLRVPLTGTLRHLTLAAERDTLRIIHSDLLHAVEAGDPGRTGAAVDAHFDWLDELFEKESRQR